MVHRFAAVPIGLGLVASYAFCADEKPAPAPKPPKVQSARPAQNKPAQNKAGTAKPQQSQPNAQAPGQELLNRLLKMTPEEQEKALEHLPEPQRQRIRNGLNAVAKMPSGEQKRALLRAQRLQSLPLQRQNQVKRSAKLLLQLPEERQRQVLSELRRMAPLPDDERRAYMNTEEFRNKYSPNEQQIMSNLAEIEP
jgi:hypothetical protein